MKLTKIKLNNDVSRQALMVMVALGLILFASVAWFVANRQNSGTADDIQVVDVDSTSMRLYHILGTDADGNPIEEQMDRILIQNFVPNQSEKYRLEIQNNSTVEKQISLTFHNINADFKLENSPIEPNMELATKILMSGLSADGLGEKVMLNTHITGDSLKSMKDLIDIDFLPTDEKNKIKIAENMTLAGGKIGSVYFTFTLDKEAHNEYQQMAIQVEKIQLATK